MILLLDSGNSRLKATLACRDAKGVWQYIGDTVALSHDTVTTTLSAWLAVEMAAWLAAGLATSSAADLATSPAATSVASGTQALATPPVLQAAIGVNVAGPLAAQRISDTLRAYGIEAVEWLVPGESALGLRNGYDTPTQLGADRWMALVGIWTSADVQAALASGAQTHQLVNFGTATTVDTISPDGAFVGGLIMPGWSLMRDALAQRTAQLPAAAAGGVLEFPTNTHDAINAGIAAAQAGAVMRQWMIARARFGNPPALYIAGGASDEVVAEIAQLMTLAGACVPLQRVAHPALDGLRAVLRQRDDN